MSQIDFRRPFYAQAAVPAPAAQWHPLDALRHQMERFYYDLSGGLWAQQSPPFGAGAAVPGAVRDFPAVDIAETDKGYELTTELPGIAEKDVSVSIDGGLLKIAGERRQQREDSHKGYFLQERSFGSFARAFRLPEDADNAKIEAVFKNGLLTVTLPKAAGAGAQTKKIAIKTA